MTPINQEELRELQMELLDYIDSFCRKNDIKYTISGGTFLGAIRHGGFIPWDDDMDIQMLRDEYDRFNSLWNLHREDHPYELVSIESGNSMGYSFGKVHNPQTVTYVYGAERTGVYIDVFPVDTVENDADFRLRRKKIVSLLRKENAAFVLSTRKNRNLSLFNQLKYLLLTMGRPRVYFSAKVNEVAKLKNDSNGRMVFEMVAGVKCKRPIPKDVFDEYEDVQFENRKYMSVKDYDTYLTCTFGDYMTPPPIDKQKRDHNFVPYWRE